jgi:hypothetical protein
MIEAGLMRSLLATCGLALILATTSGALAREASRDQFPYSIMAPEPGSSHRHTAGSSHQRSRVHAPNSVASRPTGRHLYATRGSSGSVLPTPLPRTPLIPPEGGGISASPTVPFQQGHTFVPSAPTLGAVPNLPHGQETFQDRASRCAHQQGLYGVPGNLSNQYIGACVQ